MSADAFVQASRVPECGYRGLVATEVNGSCLVVYVVCLVGVLAGKPRSRAEGTTSDA